MKTQDEAKQIIDQINKGASFAKIAAEKSLDEESKDRGGILDWTSASVFTGQLSSAIMGLKKGEMDKAPVQSPAGFHVVFVRLNSIRSMKPARKSSVISFCSARFRPSFMNRFCALK